MRLRVLALLAAAPLLAATPASADTSGHVSNVTVDNAGHVTLTLTAPGLPSGAGLDPTGVRLLVDGHAVPATAAAAATRQVPGERVTAMLVVDTSGSMRGAGIVDARTAAQEFLAAVPKTVNVGLETFSDSPRLITPPSLDRAQVLAPLPGLRASGKTALYDALAAAAAAAGQTGLRRLVVVSDGADTASHTRLADVIATLVKAHVAAEVVGLNTRAADNTVLQQIAQRTGGRFVVAGDGASLAAALRSSARSYATAVTVHASVPTALWGIKRHLRVVVQSSAGTVIAGLTTSIGAVALPAPTSNIRNTSRATLWEGLLAIAVALLIGSVALFGGDAGSRRRVRRIVDHYSMTAEAKSKTSDSIRRTALDLADRLARSRGWNDRLNTKLVRAGLSLTPSEWLLLQVGIAFVSALLFILFGMSPVLAALVGVIVGPIIGHLFLGFRFSRRRAAFIAALPDTLQLIAGSLLAGYSLAQSLDGIVNQGAQPVAGELGRALAESRLGIPIERTLEHVAERMDSEDFRWVVLAIQIQHKVGGNLAEVLLTVAQTMRERVQLQRHVRALSAEGRLSAYILVGLPVFFTLYLFTARREYLQPLYTTKLGIVMIAFAGILLTIGTIVMKKMVKVEA